MPKEKLAPDPERFGQTKGRQIDLPSKMENFTALKEGEDYELKKVNEKITSEKNLRDFFVFANPGEKDVMLKVSPPHWRTITFPEVESTLEAKVHDEKKFYNKPIPYYAVNAKGIGFLKPTAEEIDLKDYESWTRKDPEGEHDFGHQILGLSSKADFLNIMQKSNFLVENGLRTEAYWAIAKLKKVYYKGKLTPLDELRKKGVILKRRDYQPHMALRLLKTNDRIAEADESDERREEIFNNAFDVFNKETDDRKLKFPKLDIENKDHQKIFFNEFFKRMGANLAGLLNVGYSHFRMHSANITTAAEVADIGTMGHWSEGKGEPAFNKKYNGVRRQHIKDMRDIAYGLKKFLKAGRKNHLDVGELGELKNSFMEGFRSVFNPKQAQEIQKINSEMAEKWTDEIMQKVIVERKRLAPLLHDKNNDTIEKEWDIKF